MCPVNFWCASETRPAAAARMSACAARMASAESATWFTA